MIISIKDIIGIIPEILQYFVSGFIFVFIFKTICSKKIDNTMQLIGSCVLSFIWVSLIKSLNEIIWGSCLLSNLWVIVMISILLSLITSLIFSKIYTSNCFRNRLVKWFGISPHNSVWDNVVNRKATNIKVYLKGKEFYWIGHLYSYEDNGNDSWFCIHKPIKYDQQNQMLYNQGNNENAYLIFKINDVECIEIFV